MEYFVYIIYSQSQDTYYKGYTTDPKRRLVEHQMGQGRFTEGKGPWKLVYLKEFPTKKDALIEELRLKRLNRKSLEALIKSMNLSI